MFLEYFIKGFENFEINYVCLDDINYETCDGCFACWYKNIGSCIIKDDFNKVYQSIIDSDYVVYASPLYALMINGAMKTFIDRLSMVTHEPFKKYDPKTHRTSKSVNLKLPPAIVLMVGNMIGQEPFRISSEYYKAFFSLLETDLIAEIYRPESEFFKFPIMEKVQKEIYAAFTQGGKELVKNGKISSDTLEVMTKDLVSPKIFVEGHNMFWKICQNRKIHPKNFDFERYSFMKLQ